ncbi:MAG: hypothetical protein ACOYI6_04055 [Christensenellales bacterium]|jgi:hypothetical protein
MNVVLELIGRDSWSRPVYCHGSRLYVDVCPISDKEPELFTKQGNSLDGEPCDPINPAYSVTFSPERDTWR